MSGSDFDTLEQAGWNDRAAIYEHVISPMTRLANNTILDSFDSISGKKYLDVACGIGHLVEAASTRGATAKGIDYAPEMVNEARVNYPDHSFEIGDATDLPYGSEDFDCISCAFGLLHISVPDKAIAEAYRVLKAGGRYTFTVWARPDQGSELFKLVMGSIRKYGDLNVPLPPAPNVFRFSEFEESAKTLREAGFSSPSNTLIPISRRLKEPQTLLNNLYKTSVRTSMLLNAQTDGAQKSINESILTGAEQFRQGDEIVLAVPAWLVTAVKPES